ncbi:MAG: GNAT family N-acetyltransferase, partial [Williamsia herbipolensis]|nr:GNAT family N-acetyltransferase [Williamsia herbipolensis]
MSNEAFDERYDLRELHPELGEDGIPTPDTVAFMDAIGLGFHEASPSVETASRMVEDMRADEETWVGVYLRRPFAGSVDETWPAGTFAWFAKDLSWGDGSTLRTQAISAVTVRPTERRRGILRRMMTHALSRAVDEGYAVASLTASEGTIYRRFGFGAAIRERAITVKRPRALPLLVPTTGTVSVVTPAYLAGGVARRVFDRFHARTPGSMVRNTGTWNIVLGLRDGHGEVAKDVRAAVHRADGSDEVDGYVTWRAAEQAGQPTRVSIVDLVYATDEAYLALWEFLLSIDLNDEVVYNR